MPVGPSLAFDVRPADHSISVDQELPGVLELLPLEGFLVRLCQLVA